MINTSPLITPGKYDFTYNEALGFFQGKLFFYTFSILIVVGVIIWCANFILKRRKRLLAIKKDDIELQREELAWLQEKEAIEMNKAKIESNRIAWEKQIEYEKAHSKEREEQEKEYNAFLNTLEIFQDFAHRLDYFNGLNPNSNEFLEKFIKKNSHIIDKLTKYEDRFYAMCDPSIIIKYELVKKHLKELEEKEISKE